MKISYENLTAIQIERLKKHLSKVYRFRHGVMTLDSWLQQYSQTIHKKLGNHRSDYKRRYFNSLDYAGQAIYDKYLDRVRYDVRYVWYDDIYVFAVPKIVFDALVE